MIVILLFLFGLSIGSFINVVRIRLPSNQSILYPSSNCRECCRTILWYDNIPIISWILLRAKCRFCKSKISISYPLIELLTSGLIILNLYSYQYFSVTNYITNFIGISIFSLVLLSISLIDIEHLKIPNRLNLSAFILAIFYLSFIQDNFIEAYSILASRFLNSSIAFASFEIVSLLYYKLRGKVAFGMGDSKLTFVIAFWLGFKGWLISLLLSIYLAGLYILLLYFSGSVKMSNKIPFAPFMSIGAYLVLFFGKDYWTSILSNIFLYN